MSTEIKNLLDIAKSEDGLSDSEFDKFLRLNGWRYDSLSTKVDNDHLFLYYSKYYYMAHGRLPHRKSYTGTSTTLKTYKTRIRKNGKLGWAFRCSEQFKNNVNTFMDEHGEKWQKKLSNIQNAKRAHHGRKINRKENKQLEKHLQTLHSVKDSTQK